MDESAGRTRPPSAPFVPYRVKRGAFREEGLYVETTSGKETLPWGKIRLVCLGIVEEYAQSPPPMSKVRKMMRELFFGSGIDEEEGKRPEKKRVTYVDFFMEGSPRMFRIESTSLDYRGLLPAVGYVSEENFRELVLDFYKRIPEAVFDESFQAYLTGKIAMVKKYQSLYDFQGECQERWKRMQEQSSLP